MKVVSNSSPIIALTNIEELHLLSFLFEEVFIPESVQKEIGIRLDDSFSVLKIKDINLFNHLSSFLGKGEAAAIVLAKDINADLTILDDKEARKTAKSLGLKVIGTVGLLILGKNRAYYTKIRPILKKLELVNFRLSENLLEEILRSVSEEDC